MTSRAEYRLPSASGQCRSASDRERLSGGADLRRTLSGSENKRASDRRRNGTCRSWEYRRNQSSTEFLEAHESTLLKSGTTIGELVRRPELDYEMLAEIDKNRPQYSAGVREQVNINIKYQGYIRRQMKQVEQFKENGKQTDSEDINYDEVKPWELKRCRNWKIPAAFHRTGIPYFRVTGGYFRYCSYIWNPEIENKVKSCGKEMFGRRNVNIEF